jgi:hypothetical protein
MSEKEGPPEVTPHISRVSVVNIDYIGPKGTWKRTYETERKGANRTDLEMERMAQDQIEWRQFVSALCASGLDED